MTVKQAHFIWAPVSLVHQVHPTLPTPCHKHTRTHHLAPILRWVCLCAAISPTCTLSARHPASPIHHTSKHTAPHPSMSHRPESACQCAPRQVSPPCVTDYPIFSITCPTRRRGPGTTKPPLFTSLHTMPTRLIHHPSPAASFRL